MLGHLGALRFLVAAITVQWLWLFLTKEYLPAVKYQVKYWLCTCIFRSFHSSMGHILRNFTHLWVRYIVNQCLKMLCSSFYFCLYLSVQQREKSSSGTIHFENEF